MTGTRSTNRRTLLVALMTAAAALGGCQTRTLLSLPGVEASDSAEDILAKIRADAGLVGLVPDRRLERAAKEQAEFMARAGKMAHTAIPGQDFATRIRRAGIEGAAAENIARGRYEPDRLFLAWMNSSGHRRNMLDERFTRFGLASATSADGRERYWALIVAR